MMTPEDLLAQYGSNFEGDFEPHTRNIRTGAISTKTHHCSTCGLAITKRCYTNFHLGYCLELVPESDKEGAPIVIHGERFTLRSRGGCWKHPYSSGGNEAFKNLKLGKDLDASEMVEDESDTDEQQVEVEDEANEEEDEFNYDEYMREQREAKDAEELEKKKEREKAKTAAAEARANKADSAKSSKQQPALAAKEFKEKKK